MNKYELNYCVKKKRVFYRCCCTTVNCYRYFNNSFLMIFIFVFGPTELKVLDIMLYIIVVDTVFVIVYIIYHVVS